MATSPNPVKKVIRNSVHKPQRKATNWVTGAVRTSVGPDMPNNVSAYAVWSRKKPLILNSTGMVIEETRWNEKTYTNRTGFEDREGDLTYCYPGVFVDGFTAESDNGALPFLKAKAKAGGSDWNLAESLAELNQTANMIANRLGDLARFANNLRRGNFAAIAKEFKRGVPGAVQREKPSKRLANGYLEVQFGWMPAVSDAYSAVEAYHKGISTRGSKVTKRSGSSRDTSTGIDATGGLYFDPSKLGSNAQVNGIISNPTIAKFNELGLLNPALVAWNKMPMSFVIDWFLPISTILASMTVGAGWALSYGSITTRKVTGTKQRDQPGQLVRLSKSVNRIPAAVNGMPDLAGALLSPNLGLWHLATATSLARQSWR